MAIRKEVTPIILTGVISMAVLITVMILFCVSVGERGYHLATVAILTTSGPLFARVFEGVVRRSQIKQGLSRDGLEAEDEVLIARTAPLVMPVVGAMFAYSVMM
jgi:uncharacterized membrane protein